MEDSRVSTAASLPENFLHMPWAIALLFPWKACNTKRVDKPRSRATSYRRVTSITAIPFVTLQLRQQQRGLEEALAQSSPRPKAKPRGLLYKLISCWMIAREYELSSPASIACADSSPQELQLLQLVLFTSFLNSWPDGIWSSRL